MAWILVGAGLIALLIVVAVACALILSGSISRWEEDTADFTRGDHSNDAG